MDNNPIIYPIFFFAMSLVAGTLAFLLSMVLVTREVRKSRIEAVRIWRNSRLRFLIGPSSANFLNKKRTFGAGGNGTLLLTDEAVRFAQTSPKREIVIPLKDIECAQLMKEFNGRWGGGPFLVVRRKVGDLTGFQISNPQKWEHMINAQVSLNEKVLAGMLPNTDVSVSVSQ